jgi:hypothetical protein
MKNSAVIFFALLFLKCNLSFSQGSFQQKDTANFPYWTRMMQDPEANFRSTQSAFEKYWANRTD